MAGWIGPDRSFRGLVAEIYYTLAGKTYKILPMEVVWELERMGLNPDWDQIWSNLSEGSKNLSQLIHFKLIYRKYAIPYKRFLMKIISPNCTHCTNNVVGTVPGIVQSHTHFGVTYAQCCQD